jgi:hypothetical protein
MKSSAGGERAVTEEPFQSNPRVRALPPHECHVGSGPEIFAVMITYFV